MVAKVDSRSSNTKKTLNLLSSQELIPKRPAFAFLPSEIFWLLYRDVKINGSVTIEETGAGGRRSKQYEQVTFSLSCRLRLPPAPVS